MTRVFSKIYRKRKELLTKVFESWQIFHDMFKARELARKLANEAPPLALRTRGVKSARPKRSCWEADGWLDKLTGFTVTIPEERHRAPAGPAHPLLGRRGALAPARLLAPAPASAVSGGGKDYAEATIKGQDFSGKTFNNKDFSGCDAVDTNFAKSKLRGARFFKADLARADFSART
ncbi:hypothetical protein JL720_11771 [Aureococcus anophagefferens]|nr:hypothetical protein JL720_11771 [Aureococcus anophagefferens]